MTSEAEAGIKAEAGVKAEAEVNDRSKAEAKAEDESEAGSKAENENEEEGIETPPVNPFEDTSDHDKLSRLRTLLSRSEIYAKIMHDKLLHPPPPPKTRVKKVPKASTDHRQRLAETTLPDSGRQFPGQPKAVSGAELREYQKVGVGWLLALDSQGVSGILADEMGLGKTLQTIAFLAALREQGTWGPFLIVCPLSVLHNWVSEFQRFAPSIPVVKYHGSKPDREAMRDRHLASPSQDKDIFPVVITTFEMAMRDREALAHIQWRYIVVDEGHRLKNLNCKLIRELKSYSSANRLILTGTPLHNNLSELWSLLNFILPQLFDDLDVFQQWFDFSALAESKSEDEIEKNSASIVASLHEILRPFLLRRLKIDVEKTLPPKKEYLLYAPLTHQQKELYDAIVSKDVRQYLISAKTSNEGTPATSIASSSHNTDNEEETGSISSRVSRTRKKARKSYADESDAAYMRRIEGNGPAQDEDPQPVIDVEAVGREYALKRAQKEVGQLKLQNCVMQLRKVCCHPFLFDWPRDPQTGLEVTNQDLIDASGKMLLLDRLLVELFRTGHKVLVFSQFTKMLDIIHDWANEYKGWSVCRIDGQTNQMERQEQLKEFTDAGDVGTSLFLLSTRAGGLGLNIVEADTVIFFDSDWNPQVDLQAMDRAHRIGQKRPVLVFRLIAQHTVEQSILQRAGSKRKLENLVIAQGQFKSHGLPNIGKKKQATITELVEALQALEEDKVNLVRNGDEIISDENLAKLLDRSPEAMAREKGWGTALGTVMEMERDDVHEKLATRM